MYTFFLRGSIFSKHQQARGYRISHKWFFAHCDVFWAGHFPRKLVKAHISATLRVFAEYKSDVSYYQVTLSPKLFSHFSIFENSSGKMQDFVISIASLAFTEGKLKACKH